MCEVVRLTVGVSGTTVGDTVGDLVDFSKSTKSLFALCSLLVSCSPPAVRVPPPLFASER
jgi:hypothetical protein